MELAVVIAIDAVQVEAGVMEVAIATLALGSPDGSIEVNVARRCRERHVCYWLGC